MYEDVVRALGTVFDNRRLYGASHKVTIQSMELSFDLLSAALNSEEALVLTIAPDEFSINHNAVETKNVLVHQFVEMLRGHEVSTLTITAGITADEFLQFIDLVSQEPTVLQAQGGFASILHADVFSHISSKKVTYVELTEEEIVVNKDAVDDRPSRETLSENIMEYLGVSSDECTNSETTEEVTKGLRELIASPAELGAVIVKSAGLSLNVDIPTTQPLPENIVTELIERIIECLERAFQILKGDPTAQSQTGKKKLKKSLKVLESDLECVIKDAVSQIDDHELSPIYSAIDAMTDELEIDALAAEYLRKRRLIESSEKRLLKYIERQGERIEACELKSKLLEGGLSEYGWNMLLFASGNEKSEASGKLSMESPEFRQLQKKLVKLTQIFNNMAQGSNASAAQLEEVISQVEEQLEKLIKQTEVRIKHIMESIIADEREAEGRETDSSRKLTRRQLLELIAEIVQELYQPLSVIQCVLQTMLSKKIATDFAEQQRELIELADHSAKRMNMLIGEIYMVVGNPTSLKPLPKSNQ